MEIAHQELCETRSPRAVVMRWVASAIANGTLAVGEPLPSERVLADRLNVSRNAVRTALTDMADRCLIEKRGNGRFRHLAPAAVHGSEVAARLGLMTNTVAILGADDVSHQPFSRGVDKSINFTVARLLEQAGHHVLAVNPKGADLREGASLACARPLGVVVAYNVGESSQGQAMIAECHDHGVPVVAYGDAPGLARFDHVDSNHEHGAYALTRHLVARGRRRILRFWCLPGDKHWLQQRNRGYERAVREAGLAALPMVRTPHLDARSRAEFDHLVRVLAGYLSEHVRGPHAIDALMTGTDLHAIQAGAALRLLGIEPNRDILIVGYDNTWRDLPEREWERTRPVATVDKHNDAIGACLVELLLARVVGKLPPEPQRRVIEPELVGIGKETSATARAAKKGVTI